MDEGRNMILLYPGLIKGIEKKENSEHFAATCHMFYPQRIVDIKDGKTKWAGLDNNSDILDDEGNVIKKWEEVKKEREEKEKDDEQGQKRKREQEGEAQSGDPKEGKV